MESQRESLILSCACRKSSGEAHTMSWILKRRAIQLRIILRSNRGVFMMVLAWFAVIYGLLLNSGMDPARAARLMCYLEQANNSQVGFFYQSVTDIVFFGLVVSVLLLDVQRQVRPEITSRILAQEMQDHAVVINLNNLGRRAFELFKEHVPVAVLDSDPARIEDLIHKGYPCAVSSVRHASDLDVVNIAQARLVLISCDDLETVPVLCNWVRRANPECTLIASCHEDEIGDVLAKRYRATIVSTSKLAAEFLREYASRQTLQRCLLIGCGQLGRRMIPILQRINAEFTFLVDKPDEVEDLVDDCTFLFGPSHDRDLLEAAGVRRCELVILTEDSLAKALTTVDRIRQLNTSCRIVCRVFQDDSADMLSSPPFGCDVISTSRYTIEHLRAHDAFLKLGISPDPKSKRRHVPRPPGDL